MADHIRSDPEKLKIGPHLLKLLQLVLHSMKFSFNGDHFLKTGGKAMGTVQAMEISSRTDSKPKL